MPVLPEDKASPDEPLTFDIEDKSTFNSLREEAIRRYKLLKNFKEDEIIIMKLDESLSVEELVERHNNKKEINLKKMKPLDKVAGHFHTSVDDDKIHLVVLLKSKRDEL